MGREKMGKYTEDSDSILQIIGGVTLIVAYILLNIHVILNNEPFAIVLTVAVAGSVLWIFGLRFILVGVGDLMWNRRIDANQE